MGGTRSRVSLFWQKGFTDPHSDVRNPRFETVGSFQTVVSSHCIGGPEVKNEYRSIIGNLVAVQTAMPTTWRWSYAPR